MPSPVPPFKRLLSNYIIDDNSCWIWRGNILKTGYGQIKVFGKMYSTHRFSYELHKGTIPNNLEVMHLCNNKLCINPDHLKTGTHKENIQQAIRDGLLNHKNIKYKSVSGINKSQSKQVFVKGSVYGSINEAEKLLGVGSGTVSYWIRHKPNLARIITKENFINQKQNQNGYIK